MADRELQVLHRISVKYEASFCIFCLQLVGEEFAAEILLFTVCYFPTLCSEKPDSKTAFPIVPGKEGILFIVIISM